MSGEQYVDLDMQKDSGVQGARDQPMMQLQASEGTG